MDAYITPQAKFTDTEGNALTAYADNRGEPFRKGVTLAFDTPDSMTARIFLETSEALRLAAAIQQLATQK